MTANDFLILVNTETTEKVQSMYIYIYIYILHDIDTCSRRRATTLRTSCSATLRRLWLCPKGMAKPDTESDPVRSPPLRGSGRVWKRVVQVLPHALAGGLPRSSLFLSLIMSLFLSMFLFLSFGFIVSSCFFISVYLSLPICIYLSLSLSFFWLFSLERLRVWQEQEQGHKHKRGQWQNKSFRVLVLDWCYFLMFCND